MAMRTFDGKFCQHSAALKYFRQKCEIEGNLDGFALSNTRKAAVAAIIHPPGPGYSFVEEDMRGWSWWEMVAQLDEESIRYVVEDGDRSRGLDGCAFRPRTNSYDHSRQVQRGAPQWRLIEWDFVLCRNDGTAVRLHPEWKSPKIPTFVVEGHAEPVEIPQNGLGRSEGRGTFQRYRTLGQQETLRFGTRRGTFV